MAVYLKSLEIIGFKSFAEKTRLEFEPGLTAIVGPNGCGKSNVSDAIRWALGEQSAKALRGSKMEDVIFNGTDFAKPLSLAEVSLTLTDCEATLGTEYDEVTVTRRVLRSGEGQYFINKAPCRLKDIQRLFMDTGIGTNSYSLMEQGRIDQILSSRPEDRRSVFEEASGITKFKMDKREAIRKLETTEANLLRLADIIREVRRRIISLQRQAGKARRYKELQDTLRAHDVYLSRERLNQLSSEIQSLETRLGTLIEQEEALRTDIQHAEEQANEQRATFTRVEEEITQAMEAVSRTSAERERTLQSIQINQDRIAEMQLLSERDSKDADEAQIRLQTHRESGALLDQQWEAAKHARATAEEELARSNSALKELDGLVESIRHHLNQLRVESIDLDGRSARLQNELSRIDAEERNSSARRERLSAELNETKRSVERFEGRRTEAEADILALREEVATAEDLTQSLVTEQENITRHITEQRGLFNERAKRIAARTAQSDLIRQPDAAAEGMAPGARRLLSTTEPALMDRSLIWGPLAEHIQAKPDYQKALEAALRTWLDAVVVEHPAALLLALHALEDGGEGSARLLAATGHPPTPSQDGLPGEALLDHVEVADRVRPLVARLLANVRVVDALPTETADCPENAILVTPAGAVWHDAGSGEVWQPGAQETNPMTRRHLLSVWTDEIDALQKEQADCEQQMAQAQAQWNQLKEDLLQARQALDGHRRNLALREGEHQLKATEARQARERMETVSFELDAIVEKQSTGVDKRAGIAREIEEMRDRHGVVRDQVVVQTEEQRKREQERSAQLSEVTEKRVHLAELRQAADGHAAQREGLRVRMAELESLIDDRRKGLVTYQSRIEEMARQMAEARTRVEPIETTLRQHQETLAATRQQRESMTGQLRALEEALRNKRSTLDELRTRRSRLDVEMAEQRMRHQNIVERIAQEYHLTPEEMEQEPVPAWENEQQPERGALETLIADLRSKLDAMGPVNLVAIEEHEELEERLKFLTTQEDDLVKAKDQLMDMIRRINRTTTEMFINTFNQVNEHFQETFKKLFGGGSAKLVLVNEEDVLESGIEIIARPPGKKLQNVSLLSGGERTMTAVALLFALYIVKPSPFCVLDELDAALDDSNINRFVLMLEGFLKTSQFIVITHNRQTIEAADALYGVTMEKHGISKIVSVRFNKHPEREQSGVVRTDPVADDSAPVPIEPETDSDDEKSAEA